MSATSGPPQPYESLAKENKYLRNQNIRLRDKERAIENLIVASAAVMPKPRIVKSPKLKTSKRNLEYHALRGDEHAGAKITALDINGIGSYNLKIYKKYIELWTKKIIQFKREDEKALGLNKLIITHLGDWLEGESIYPGQSFYIDESVVNVIYNHVLPLETESLLQLARIFPKIELFCVTGNHGRAGKKGDHHWRSSFEYMMLRTLQLLLQDQKNITIYISESPSMLVRHGDFTFCYNHGSHLSSNYGVPYYSLDRTFKALPGLYNMVVDFYICGHRHTPVNITDNIIMNGSLMGGSDLSVNRMLRASRASQKIFYFDPQKGINRKTDIYLEDRLKLKADKNGIFTPYIEKA